MDVLTLFVLPALVGVVIGIMSGLLGIGGGTVMVPIFRLAFGMSPVMSTATSLFAIIPTSISGAASHIRHKTCIVSLGVAAGLGGALTSPLGVWLAQISPAWLIMVAAALIIGWSAVKMLSKAFKLQAAKKRAAGEGRRVGGGWRRRRRSTLPPPIQRRASSRAAAAHQRGRRSGRGRGFQLRRRGQFISWCRSCCRSSASGVERPAHR